jgi:hypothetical protein
MATGTASGVVTFGGQGVSLTGNGTLTGVTGAAGLLFDWTGSGSGTFLSSTQPALWNFTITGPGTSTSNWTLNFIMNPASPIVTTYMGSVGAGGGTVSTTFAPVNTPAGTNFTNYEVKLQIDTNFTSSTQTLTVNVPANTSIDINPAAPTVPEPASMFLGAVGLAGLLGAKLVRRRK